MNNNEHSHPANQAVSMGMPSRQLENAETQESFQELFAEYMSKVQKRKAATMGIASSLVTFVTAPMITLSTSLQLSVMYNRKTYDDFKNTSLTKSKHMLGSGITSGKPEISSAAAKINLPYRAPVYANYLE